MSSSIIELFGISGPNLGECGNIASDYLRKFGRLGGELQLLLSDANGFYAFESSLHVLPAESRAHYTDLMRWNKQGLWKDSYNLNLEHLLCFAEDIFGGQFCIREESISYFEPETGRLDRIASSIDDWAKLIIGDYNSRTGFPLAHQWQTLNGPLPVGQRLIPKCPFILGGDFTKENLVAYDAIKAMRLRGELSRQIRDLPDGSQILYSINKETTAQTSLL